MQGESKNLLIAVDALSEKCIELENIYSLIGTGAANITFIYVTKTLELEFYKNLFVSAGLYCPGILSEFHMDGAIELEKKKITEIIVEKLRNRYEPKLNNDVRINYLVKFGSIVDEIIDASERLNAFYVVVGVAKRVNRFSFGSRLIKNLSNRCTKPLVVLPCHLQNEVVCH